jgi:hypothetical protein
MVMCGKQREFEWVRALQREVDKYKLKIVKLEKELDKYKKLGTVEEIKYFLDVFEHKAKEWNHVKYLCQNCDCNWYDESNDICNLDVNPKDCSKISLFLK